MIRTQDAWMRIFEAKRALWIHDGNPRRPHALLTTSKEHSIGFFKSELVMEDPCLLEDACFDLAGKFPECGLDIDIVDRVVGPTMGAITLTHELARHIGRERVRPPCLRAYTEKAEGMMVFKNTLIQRGDEVLLVDDVLTTGASVGLTANAVELAGGSVLPFVVVLVNRSGLVEVDGRKIIALIHRNMPTWAPFECPLCKLGSEALRPKGAENWARLNADY